MPYPLRKISDNRNVGEQLYAYGNRVRIPMMTSCISLVGRFTFGRVVAVHLVVFGQEATFDSGVAQSAANIVAGCWERAIVGHIDCWAALPAFGELQDLVRPKIVDLSGPAIYGLEFKTACRKLHYRTDSSGWAPV
ncbi:MAG: hypothetical protein K0V04_15455 [Deltaproteobacteria bacterium]|nr:hypothetical protein [Deltaproteobacteria bacterium]